MESGVRGRPSEVRLRLLRTASQIFYTEGLHSVGVDRIITEANTTRATFYRHFPGKEDLVVAYLAEADRGLRERFVGRREASASAAEALRAVAADIADDIRREGFRGCAFLNAAAEYPEPENPVHRQVMDHRDWFLGAVTELFEQDGMGPAGPAGRHFVMLRDGAMVSGCLSDPDDVCPTFLYGVDGLLWSRTVVGTTRT